MVMQKKYSTTLLIALLFLATFVIMKSLESIASKERTEFIYDMKKYYQNDQIVIFINYHQCKEYTRHFINLVNNYYGNKKIHIYTNKFTYMFLRDMGCTTCKIEVFEPAQLKDIIDSHDLIIVLPEKGKYIVDSEIYSIKDMEMMIH